MQKRFNPGGSIDGSCDRHEEDVFFESNINDILGERARAGLWIEKHESEDLAVSKEHPDQIWPVYKQSNTRTLGVLLILK